MEKSKLFKEYLVVNDDLSFIKLELATKKSVLNVIYLVVYIIIILLLILITLFQSNSRLNSELTKKDSVIVALADSINKLNYDNDVTNLHYLSGKYLNDHVTSQPTEKEVKELLEECNAWYPEVILAQCKLESGLGTSQLSKTTNNLFGIKSIKCKNTTQSNSYAGYGVYKNWKLSVLDRVLLDYRFFNSKPTKSEYYDKLLCKYAEDETYIEKLNSIVKKLK